MCVSDSKFLNIYCLHIAIYYYVNNFCGEPLKKFPEWAQDLPVPLGSEWLYFIRKHKKETALAAKAKKRKEGKDSSDEEDEDNNDGLEDEEDHDEETSELDPEEVANAGRDLGR